MTGKNNPNNSMNDKRDYEVEECVSFSRIRAQCCRDAEFQHEAGFEAPRLGLKDNSCCLQVPLPQCCHFILLLGQVLGSSRNWHVL